MGIFDMKGEQRRNGPTGYEECCIADGWFWDTSCYTSFDLVTGLMLAKIGAPIGAFLDVFTHIPAKYKYFESIDFEEAMRVSQMLPVE